MPRNTLRRFGYVSFAVLFATVPLGGCATTHARKNLTFAHETRYTPFKVSRAAIDHNTLFIELQDPSPSAVAGRSAVVVLPLGEFQRELETPRPDAMRLLLSWEHPETDTYLVRLSPVAIKPARVYPEQGASVPVRAGRVEQMRAAAVGMDCAPCVYPLTLGGAAESVLAIALPGVDGAARRVAFITDASVRHPVAGSYWLMSLAVAFDAITGPFQIMLAQLLSAGS